VPNGLVNLTIQDTPGASVTVPQSQVQLVMGTCSGGVAQQIVATRSIATLISSLGYGQLTEYCGLAVNAGATVLAIKMAPTTPGTATAVAFTGTGTSVITTSLDGTNGAFDDYLVEFLVITGGTKGVAGITFQISLDGAKSFSSTIALGTAATYVIPNTGITLNFAAGTLVAGDIAKFSTAAPLWNTASVQTALTTTFFGSAYAMAGVGSMKLLGKTVGSDASTIETYLDTLATNFSYDRLMVDARDAAIPIAWGGAGETESAWMTAVQADYSAVSARRILASVGHYGTPSVISNPVCGNPRYRRSGGWSQGVREVGIPPQRHSGRVKDGTLSNIVVSPTTDPLDGFIYHDERLNPGFDAARFCAFWTRIGQPLGFFVKNPNLMSPAGSFFTILPLGNAMDLACDIVTQVGAIYINDDIRTNSNGTIYVNDALVIQNAVQNALYTNLTANSIISGSSVTVDQTNNVQSTKTVNMNVVVTSRGYILQENISIGFSA
jgi:hypothetical protein